MRGEGAVQERALERQDVLREAVTGEDLVLTVKGARPLTELGDALAVLPMERVGRRHQGRIWRGMHVVLDLPRHRAGTEGASSKLLSPQRAV